MSEKFIRRPDYASGPLTEAEKAQMAEITALWVQRALRTDPIEPDKIVPAIHSLYRIAGLPIAHVVIVPSPLVMALAGMIAATWWAKQDGFELSGGALVAATRAATQEATRAATEAATQVATRAATWAATQAATEAATQVATQAATWAATQEATGAATWAATQAATEATTEAATEAATWTATWVATREATQAATRAATRAATEAATQVATRAATWVATREAATRVMAIQEILSSVPFTPWTSFYQGGNMWAAHHAYYAACRDVLGLQLPVFEKYAAWEACGIHGGFRFMHKKFCLVSDFPEFIHTDERHLPHCATGPSHRWRDGWSIWSWHGVQVTEQIILHPETITGEQIMAEKNQQVQAVMIERVGVDRVCRMLKAKVLHRKTVTIAGQAHAYELLELMVSGNKWRYLKMLNPSVPGIYHVEGVSNSCKTVDDALHFRKPGWMQTIPVKQDGLDWYQQGDVYIVPEGATAIKPYPALLT